MVLIQWSDEFSTGIPVVDHEHQELVDRINRLHALLERQGAAAGEAAVSNALATIHDEIAAHFALEEKIMRDGAFDGYGAHKADHESLLESIREIMEGYELGDYLNRQAALGKRVRGWFLRHVKLYDLPFHQTEARDA